MAIDQEKLTYWFAGHEVQPEHAALIDSVRQAARAFAQAIVDHTPPNPDQSSAIRKVREAMLIAIEAVLGGRY